MPSLDVVSAFQSYGKYLEMGATEEAEKVRLDTVRNSCRKEGGACGGEWSCAVLSGAGKRRGN
jgi:dihydroxy-acid dehydratase